MRRGGMRARALLYPNPPFHGDTLTDIWGREYVMRNEPFLEVEFHGLDAGEYEAELCLPIRQRERLNGSAWAASAFFVHPALANPSLSEVTVRLSTEGKTIWESALPVSVHSIRGQVKDFEGQPFPAYLWAVEEDLSRPQAMVQTDPEGNFVFWYPAGKPVRLFIDDETYSQTTYECWVTVERLEGDIEIHPRVGNFEVWGLHCWHNELVRQVYFWPVSLPLDLRARKAGRRAFYGPRLTKRDVTVRVNGEEVAVIGFRNVRVSAGGGRTHLACLLEFPFQPGERGEPVLIQVEVNTKSRGRGEAWYVAW